MTTQQERLDFYTHPTTMTSGREHSPMFDELPHDVAALARVVQGLLLHEHAAPTYGVALSDERRSESYIRSVERMLDHLLTHSDQPLSVARPVEARLVGVCRHFTVLLIAMLRAQGVPTRARCGFGSYFHPGHDRFTIAGDAWTQCRAGKGDPAKFGIFDLRGLWFIAGNLIRDVATLNNMEMLPWDVWGAMPRPDESI